MYILSIVRVYMCGLYLDVRRYLFRDTHATCTGACVHACTYSTSTYVYYYLICSLVHLPKLHFAAYTQPPLTPSLSKGLMELWL